MRDSGDNDSSKEYDPGSVRLVAEDLLPSDTATPPGVLGGRCSM